METNKKRRGGQPGNRNAVKHGAYARSRWENLTESQQQEVNGIPLRADSVMEYALRMILIREADLENRMQQLRADGEDTLHLTSASVQNGHECQNYTSGTVLMQQLEAEIGRNQGRLLKLLDSMRASEDTARRADMEQQRLELNRQKAIGIFELNAEDAPESI